MFEKIIEFSAHPSYYSLKEDFPIPAKLNIPKWYKDLEHDINYKTVKGCMPFLDSLTAGYLLKLPQDFWVRHNVINSETQKKDSFQTWGLYDKYDKLHNEEINLNSGIDTHSTQQLNGSPYIEKNKNFPFHKILNPWKIKTPKGYSCLFIPPMNNSDDRFSIIPGIVDTDSYNLEINFPIVINGDKYPVLNTVIKKGTVYVQIIPFKRESWKMLTKMIDVENHKKSQLFYRLKLLNVYKDKYWSKKIWK
jgi:hypothetical protein